MLRLLDRAGAPAPVPREWETMLVEARVPAEAWERAELTRNGAPLPLALRRLGGATRVVAEWPRSGCGRYALRLRVDGEEHRAEWEVHPEKIGPDAFGRLLDDLEARLPASVALGLQRAGGLAGVDLLPPQESTLAAELVRLRRAVLGTGSRPGLVSVLHALAPDPHRVLRAVEQWTRAERARRPHPARMAQALAQGRNVDAAGGPIRVLDTRVEHTFDVYENRLLNTFVSLVRTRLRRLEPVLRAPRHAPLAAQAAELGQALHAARRRAPFLDEAGTLSHTPDRLTMVLLKRDPYRAALEGLLELHRRVAVQLRAPGLEAPLENLPGLYQLWGTLQVADALLHVAAEHGWRVSRQRLVQRTGDGLFVQVLPDNRAAITLARDGDGCQVRLIPERVYGRAGDLRSFTYRQIPDVAVELRSPGAAPRVWLFDPKYKLDGEPLVDSRGGGKPKKVDIDKMHAYRDAIRTPAGRRVVRRAAILYPGPPVRYPGGIEAVSAIPGGDADLQKRLRAILSRALQGADSADRRPAAPPSDPG
jgi:hypothetical protein